MPEPTVLTVVGTIDRSMVDRIGGGLTVVDTDDDELLIVEPEGDGGEA